MIRRAATLHRPLCIATGSVNLTVVRREALMFRMEV
jgi:hypothetical protein